MNIRRGLQLWSTRQTRGSNMKLISIGFGNSVNADRIVVLNDGEIDGIGTHEELLRSCEVYQEIAKSQLSEKELGLKESEVADHE